MKQNPRKHEWRTRERQGEGGEPSEGMFSNWWMGIQPLFWSSDNIGKMSCNLRVRIYIYREEKAKKSGPFSFIICIIHEKFYIQSFQESFYHPPSLHGIIPVYDLIEWQAYYVKGYMINFMSSLNCVVNVTNCVHLDWLSLLYCVSDCTHRKLHHPVFHPDWVQATIFCLRNKKEAN